MRRLVLGIAVAVTSLIPVLGMADDQQIADFIKSRLQAEQSQGNLKGFNVDMRVENGTVWFKGHVSNPAQEMTILTSAQQAGHLGVVKVVDDIEVKAVAALAEQSAVFQEAAMPAPAPMRAQRQIIATPVSNPISAVVFEGEPLPFATSGGTAMPDGHTANVGTPSEAPNLPGYAWPAYAAHPNYGAVTYPEQYSPSAWPYIGPFYPYPQVPLGWRKVSLEWDDGWWMLDFHDK